MATVLSHTHTKDKSGKGQRWQSEFPPPSLWVFSDPASSKLLYGIPTFSMTQEAALEANRLPECWSTVTSFPLKDNPKFRLEKFSKWPAKLQWPAGEGTSNSLCTNGFHASILLSLSSWQTPHRVRPKVCLVQCCISKRSKRWVSGIPQVCQFQY